MNSRDSLECFIELAELWSPFVQKVHKQFICEKDVNGNWHLKFAQLFFASRPFVHLVGGREIKVETDSFYLYSAVEDLAKLDTLALLKDCVASPSVVKGLKGLPDGMSSAASSVSMYFENEGSKSLPTRPNRWPSLTCNFDHVMHTESRRDLDLELKTLDQPFANLVDLLSWAGFDTSLGKADQMRGRAEFILTPPIGVLDRVSIEGGRLIGAVSADPAVAANSIKVGLVDYSIDESQMIRDRRTSVVATQLKATKMPQELVAYDLGCIEIAGPSCRLFISIGGEVASEEWAQVPSTQFNQLYSIFCELGPGDGYFVDQFFERKNLENRFEQQVSLLFEFLDNRTLHLGRLTGYSDEIDVVSQSREGHLYLIECTISGIDNNNKLAKLKARVDSLVNARMQGATALPGILGVMVTALPRANISDLDLQKAGEFGISVLPKEQLEELLSSLNPPPAPLTLFEKIVDLVPKKTNSAEPTFL